MKVIAHSGQYAFLILVSDGVASVLDIEAEPLLAAPSSTDSVLSRGYWEEFIGDEGPILELARRVAVEGEELPIAGWDAPGAPRRLTGVKVEPQELLGVSLTATGTLPVSVEEGMIFVGTGYGVLRRHEAETAGVR